MIIDRAASAIARGVRRMPNVAIGGASVSFKTAGRERVGVAICRILCVTPDFAVYARRRW